jgi:hypothetical protein
MCQQADAGPSTAAEALAAVEAGLRYLASMRPAELTPAEQSDCLRSLAAAESLHLAATASTFWAFEASGACAEDGQISARAWLRWQTRITSAAAGRASAWSRRLAAHRDVAEALSLAAISPSYAGQICDWTDALPDEHRSDADQILLEAAAAGADIADLGGLADEIRRRVAQPDCDDGDDTFAQRRLRLSRHFQGHARLDADLTPQAAASVRAVLEALGRKAGPEDDRTQEQRDHDALEEAMRRLVAGGLPDRAGQPTQIQLTMTLPELLGLPGAREAATWNASGPPAPPGAECDAAIAPLVIGHPDEPLLARLNARGSRDAMAARAARQLSIAEAARVLSGPEGMAARLRVGLLTGPAAAPSLPLDIGTTTETVPPWLRRAIIRRDQHCRFPGCLQPPAACHVHHLIPVSEGGPTSRDNCCLACSFHHLIAIHRWGWVLTLNPDGTTVATSPDGKRVLHSHAPATAA